MRIIGSCLTAALAVAAAPAFAAQGTGEAAAPAEAGAPSNNSGAGQTVCRMQRETGSRLRRQRVCVTRQQWTEQQRADRALVEKAQTNRIWPGG